MNKIQRQAEQLCDAVLMHRFALPVKVITEAEKLKAALTPRRRPSPSSKLKGPKPKRTSDVLFNRQTIEYEKVNARCAAAGGRCEWCCGGDATEHHHVLSGSGRRRQLAAADSIAKICVPCHRAYHRHDHAVMCAARLWALTSGFGVAFHEIDRRIRKILDTQKRLNHAPAATAAKGEG